MNLEQFLTEANIAEKILSNPNLVKQLTIAFRHDHTIPFNVLAKLGPNPDNTAIVKTWAELIDNALTNSNFGNLARSGKFENYLLRQYISGLADFEKINGEAIDALGQWLALKNRSALQPIHQDFNKFTINQVIQITRLPVYRSIIEKLRNEARIKTLKKTRNELVLIDNDRYYVIVPLNYGSCYIFNNEIGINATFCTGSSNGEYYFNNLYAPQGPMISVLDKKNPNEINGKWQIHAPSNQIKNATQSRGSDASTFGHIFPGLMQDIVQALLMHKDELKNKSKHIQTPNGQGYDADEVAEMLRQKFPQAFTPKNELI
jgi:hypothetical protein